MFLLIRAGSTVGVIARSVMSAPNQEPAPVAVVQPPVAGANAHPENLVKMQRPFMDGDFEFVSRLLLSLQRANNVLFCKKKVDIKSRVSLRKNRATRVAA